MSVEDQIRAGTLDQRQLADLEKRVTELESRQLADSAAIANQYTINQAGEVTNVVNEIITESPAQQLAHGHGGKFLMVNAITGVLEWSTPAAGLTLVHGVAQVTWEAENVQSSTLEIATGLKPIKFAFVPARVNTETTITPCLLTVLTGPEEEEKRWSAGNIRITARSLEGQIPAGRKSLKFSWAVIG